MITPQDCQQCGVCCFSALDTYVRVTGDDWSRLGDAAGDLAHFIGNRAFMKMTNGHCAALSQRPRTDGHPEFFCTCYDRRPQTCRDLARGSPQCEAELERKAVVAVRFFDAGTGRGADGGTRRLP